MKRSHDAGSEGPKQTKRSKTIQACASCKKAKTRCEVLTLDPNKPVQCHRCSVLKNTCSHGELDRGLFAHLGKPFTGKEISSSSSSDSTPSVAASQPPGENINEQFPRPDYLWSFVKQQGPLDWKYPITALQELAKQPFMPTETVSVITDRSLDDILTRPQIAHLLEIFTRHYVPWLNFSFIRDTSNPSLDLVCCTIASRHLEPSMRSLVVPRLQKLTEDIIVKTIFNPRSAESLDTIQSLLILSLWSPICGGAESGIRDGRLLIASAVSMAMNLHLNEASGKVMAMRDQKDKSPSEQAELVSFINKARLWTSLTNIESMLCCGSERMPLSKRTPADTYFIPMTPQSPNSRTEYRDLRLRLYSELFVLHEKAKSIRLVTPTALDSWYDGLTDVLSAMDRIRRLIAPLEVVAEHDKVQFQILLLVYHCCRLLTYYNALVDARLVFNESVVHSPSWFAEVRPHGIPIVAMWARETLSLGEAILISTLQTDATLLGTAPDQVFNMIAFGAGLVIGVKFLMIERVGIHLLGSSERLLSKVHAHLTQAYLSADHSVKRCVQLMGAMIDTWNQRDKGDYPSLHGTLTPISIDTTTPSDTSGSGSSSTGYEPNYQQLETGNEEETGNADWLNMNSHTFQDNTNFWYDFFAQGVIDGGGFPTN